MVRVALNHNRIYKTSFSGEVTCKRCKDGRYNLKNQCKDKCNIQDLTESGCGENQECVIGENGNADCKCLIPDDMMNGSVCECTTGQFINGECINTCETSEDCSGGKCVRLPEFDYKSCLCPIKKFGFNAR